MATLPPSRTNTRRPSAAGRASTPRKPQPKQNTPTIVWVLVAVAILIIGAVILINNSNEKQARAIAASKKKNEEIARKNAEIAQKAQEDRERRKKEKEERLAAAREAEKTAQQQPTTPEPAPQPEPAADTTPADEEPPTPEAGDEDTTESDPNEDASESEEDSEAVEEDEQPQLKLTGKASKKNLMAFGELVTGYTKEKDYEGLRTRLMEELTQSFPKQFADAETDILSIKVKPAMGKRALTICQALSLAAETKDEKITPDEDKFLSWLIGAKKSPALDFCSSLEKHKVSRDMALDMMLDMRAAYKENPRAAAQKARTFANPMFAGPSKKLYLRDKKVIEKMLMELLESPPANGADAQQQSAVNMCNVFRYLCGVPPHVVYDKTYQKEAQEAALACQKAGTISHDLGHHTDKCNLHMGTSDPTHSVKGYIQDAGDNNRKVRGHRAWILNHGTQKTAFGVAGIFQAQRTLDNSFAPRPEGGYAYPGRGFFPSEYLLGTGWSYYAGPDFTISPDTKVEIWMLPTSLKSNPTTEQLKKATSVPVLATFPHPPGNPPIGNSIVFEPDYSKFRVGKDGKKVGTYWIVISEGNKKIEYVVDLF
ncbi:MAG: hypothetical protein IJE66_06905 [Akkermansia sp.]|nr:hypothetical protein [Akkermansia sp.]